jgi:hypothetical protein
MCGSRGPRTAILTSIPTSLRNSRAITVGMSPPKHSAVNTRISGQSELLWRERLPTISTAAHLPMRRLCTTAAGGTYHRARQRTVMTTSADRAARIDRASAGGGRTERASASGYDVQLDWTACICSAVKSSASRCSSRVASWAALRRDPRRHGGSQLPAGAAIVWIAVFLVLILVPGR